MYVQSFSVRACNQCRDATVVLSQAGNRAGHLAWNGRLCAALSMYARVHMLNNSLSLACTPDCPLLRSLGCSCQNLERWHVEVPGFQNGVPYAAQTNLLVIAL
jgi:hypothetical protein